MKAGHEYALLGESVQGGRRDLTSIRTCITEAKIIGNDNEEVWSFGGSRHVELVDCLVKFSFKVSKLSSQESKISREYEAAKPSYRRFNFILKYFA